MTTPVDSIFHPICIELPTPVSPPPVEEVHPELEDSIEVHLRRVSTIRSPQDFRDALNGVAPSRKRLRRPPPLLIETEDLLIPVVAQTSPEPTAPTTKSPFFDVLKAEDLFFGEFPDKKKMTLEQASKKA